MSSFSDIRPYNDEEVRPVLDNLLRDKELLSLLADLQLGRWCYLIPKILSRALVRRYLKKLLKTVQDVRGFQTVVEGYMDRMIDDKTSHFTVTGLDQLETDKAFLFMSNHRDIALDPAFTNYALYHNDRDTARNAIGDNLLAKPFVSDLMRLNKSFIVNRSARGPRQILAAYRNLSAYIRHSITEDGASIWLAQREGRAKDGVDKTEPAIIKMLSMGRDKETESFERYFQALNLVPVAISYEWDPCDGVKAAELYQREHQGPYEKSEHEDIVSIGLGISGQKGHVHVSFGTPLGKNLGSPEKTALEIDRQIVENYYLHPTNYFAYYQLYQCWPDPTQLGETEAFVPEQYSDLATEFRTRISAMPKDHQQYALAIYANAIVSKLNLLEQSQ